MRHTGEFIGSNGIYVGPIRVNQLLAIMNFTFPVRTKGVQFVLEKVEILGLSFAGKQWKD